MTLPLSTFLRRLVLAISAFIGAAGASDAQQLPYEDPEPPSSGSAREEGILGDTRGEIPRELRRRRRPRTDFDTPVPRPIFFPPHPPPLGVLIIPSTTTDADDPAPEELKWYVGELFYPALSTRLDEANLGDEHTDLLDGYQVTKNALVAELRDNVYPQLKLDVDTAQRQIEAFARRQTPQVVELERVGEQLRAEIPSGGPFGNNSGDWFRRRYWKLGRGELNRPREDNEFLESQVIRASAFYQEGLSLQQRLLLREVAIELEAGLFREAAVDREDERFMFFSPFSARIPVLINLPADLAALMEQFVDDKDALKTELRDRIYELDGVLFASHRESALGELADRHAGRIAALERLAEEIRIRLRAQPQYRWPERPAPLSMALAEAIEAYQRERAALKFGLERRVYYDLEEADAARWDRNNEDRRAWQARRAQVMQAASGNYRQENEERFEALELNLERLHRAVVDFQGPALSGAAGGPDSFLTNFLAIRRQQEGYFDYVVAALQPGLSMPQRRMLFSAAVEKLSLPLPGREYQPISVPKTIIR